MDGGRKPTALVVEADADERERLASSLEAGGFDVITCSGPTGPDYSCIGGRLGRCALLEEADVVVLDMWLESDLALTGTPSNELLRLYVGRGRPVVTLGSWTEIVPSDDPLIHLPRYPDLVDLVGAVRKASRLASETA